MKLETFTLPYIESTTSLLSHLRQYGGLTALESGNGSHENGRWSIIAAAPIKSIQINNTYESAETVIQLEGLLNTIPATEHELPFIGGVLGHISYDLGIPGLQPTIALPYFTEQPKLYAGLYVWAFVIDHQKRQTHLVYWHGLSLVNHQELIHLATKNSTVSPFSITLPFKAYWSKQDYSSRIQKIHHYINSGDCYQVNLAQCFKGSFKGDTLDAYDRLKKTAQVPYASYFELEHMQFASMSPEMFISGSKGKLTTKPIKGTQPRGDNPQKDELNKQVLKESSKDKAENLMIVDLLRNDLSKNASNVKVPKLFEVESFTTVHHLVSTVTATLNSHTSPFKLLLDAFPGGSITGAPKKRAMEVIGELESRPRSFYCGSSFYCSANDNFSSNILIRSFLFQNEEVLTWAGGGIIADSKWELEYKESLDKISRLMECLS